MQNSKIEMFLPDVYGEVSIAPICKSQGYERQQESNPIYLTCL